jgi:hypothetical protein
MEIELMDAQTATSLLTFAETVGPTLRGPEAKALFGQFEQQYGDLLAAMQWFIAHGHTDESLRLASSLVAFWMATKRLAEGSGWFDQVLALPDGDNAHRGRALFDAAYLAFWMGDDKRSSSLQDQAVELGRQTNNYTVTALALVGLARIALSRGTCGHRGHRRPIGQLQHDACTWGGGADGWRFRGSP